MSTRAHSSWRTFQEGNVTSCWLEYPAAVCLTFAGLLFQIKVKENKSSWLNCVLRDDEAVYWFTIVHIVVGTWWYWMTGSV